MAYFSTRMMPDLAELYRPRGRAAKMGLEDVAINPQLPVAFQRPDVYGPGNYYGSDLYQPRTPQIRQPQPQPAAAGPTAPIAPATPAPAAIAPETPPPALPAAPLPRGQAGGQTTRRRQLFGPIGAGA